MTKKRKTPKRKIARPERRKGARNVHVIDEHSSLRAVALAHNDLLDFLTKRY